MKKGIAILILVIVVLSCSTSVLAGDIPQSLLYQEDAQLYFGKVLEYEAKGDGTRIVVQPLAVIKGNVEVGTAQVYNDPCPMGFTRVREGKIYLFTCFADENYMDIYEVTTYDTKTLKLKYAKGYVAECLEQYLNEGRYGEAKLEGMVPRNVDILRMAVGTVACVGLIGTVIFCIKKKNKQK